MPLEAGGRADRSLTASKILMLAGLSAPIWLVWLGLPNQLADLIYSSCLVLGLLSLGRSHRRLPLILPLGFTVGLAFEALGIATGVPFGRYRYVALDAARLFGVPVSVLVMWGVLSALAYLAARPLARGLKLVLLASALMVILDLALDPAMTSWRAWVWEGGWGPTWYGVPLSNFIGWFIVSSAIIGLYELVLKGGGPDDEFFTAIYLYNLALIAVHAPVGAGLLALSLGFTLLLALLLARRSRVSG